MPHVAALYRYPIKGFSPETCEFLEILEAGRVAGDRVLAFRFANTNAAPDAWSPKPGMLCLMNTPGLANLTIAFNADRNRVSVHADGRRLAAELLRPSGRGRLAEAVARYVLSLEENPLVGHPERLPLRLVGDGVTPRFHDSEAGEVSLHGRGSLQALSVALGGEVNELRFRSNIAVEGLAEWEELSWAGRRVRIGEVLFQVTRVKGRCLATHANPETGRRDLPVLTTLTAAFGQEKPTFAISLAPQGAGRVRLGDPVELVE